MDDPHVHQINQIEQRIQMKYKLNAAEVIQTQKGKAQQVQYRKPSYQTLMQMVRQHQPDSSLHCQGPEVSSAKFQAGPESKVAVEVSLKKPRFNFKTKSESESVIQSSMAKHELISFDGSSIEITEKHRNSQLEASISASNFGDVLNIDPLIPNMHKIQGESLQGYLISKIDKKEEKINKKLMEVQKSNEVYDRKIKEKQWEIELMRKRLDKEQRQFEAYQSKMVEAYDNIEPASDSLLISSRNYDNSSEKMERRVHAKHQVQCQYEGFSKKIRKQVLYGKCMILETEWLQIGYDNKLKQSQFELYFIIKVDLQELQAKIENAAELGFIINNGEFNIQVRNIPTGRKIKVRATVTLSADYHKKVGLMKLRVFAKKSQKYTFQQSTILPFTLYRNFISEEANEECQELNFVTQWTNSCDQFSRDPKGFLQTLFRTIRQVEEGVFHVNLMFNNKMFTPINILVNCRNFAIELIHAQNLIVAMTVGSFLARPKENEETKKSPYG